MNKIFKNTNSFCGRVEVFCWKMWEKAPFRFLVIGGINTLIGIIIAFICRLILENSGVEAKWVWKFWESFSFEFDISYLIQFIINLPIAYTLQAKFAFRAKLSLRRFAVYPLSSVPNFFLQQIGVWLFEIVFGWHYLIAYFLGSVLALPIMFFIIKFLVSPLKKRTKKVVSEEEFISYFSTGKIEEMDYRLFIPKNPVDKALVLHLHGSAGRGDDNTTSLNYLNGACFNHLIDTDEAFILVPQVHKEDKYVNVSWDDVNYDILNTPISVASERVLRLIEQLDNTYHFTKILITGYSMGGYGTWDLLIRHPELFQGAIPFCGGVSSKDLAKTKHIKFYIVHGQDDKVVPPNGSRLAYQTLLDLKADVRYEEIPQCGHPCWKKAYSEQTFMTSFLSSLPNRTDR